MKFREETTSFRDLLGDTPKIRVLEYLLEGRELDHSLSDIAEGAGINRITLFRMWNGLEKVKAVIHTRDIGNAKLFKLNLQNSSIKKLTEMFDKIINEDFKKLADGNLLTVNRQT
ncbi:hypothetical protein J4470_03255 [Candidatus Woesearchaeota archaeon]|nr:hypothetical protein [Candidatus Woesearchaeota archaeon]